MARDRIIKIDDMRQKIRIFWLAAISNVERESEIEKLMSFALSALVDYPCGTAIPPRSATTSA